MKVRRPSRSEPGYKGECGDVYDASREKRAVHRVSVCVGSWRALIGGVWATLPTRLESITTCTACTAIAVVPVWLKISVVSTPLKYLRRVYTGARHYSAAFYLRNPLILHGLIARVAGWI